MDSMMSVEIKQTLEREFEMFLTAQDIRALNFNKLKEMNDEVEASEESSGNKRTSDAPADDEILTGMRLLIRLIGNSEVSPDTCLRLRTREESGRGEVFLIPGVEGVASVFVELAPKIKAPASCLQLGFNDSSDNVSSMADRFLPVLFLELSENYF